MQEQQGGISAPTERQMQYIRLLEHRNRLKKKLEDKSRREAQLEAREKGARADDCMYNLLFLSYLLLWPSYI
jgi:hypothetical protein